MAQGDAGAWPHTHVDITGRLGSCWALQLGGGARMAGAKAVRPTERELQGQIVGLGWRRLPHRGAVGLSFTGPWTSRKQLVCGCVQCYGLPLRVPAAGTSWISAANLTPPPRSPTLSAPSALSTTAVYSARNLLTNTKDGLLLCPSHLSAFFFCLVPFVLCLASQCGVPSSSAGSPRF